MDIPRSILAEQVHVTNSGLIECAAWPVDSIPDQLQVDFDTSDTVAYIKQSFEGLSPVRMEPAVY